jgi:hypothetical protein
VRTDAETEDRGVADPLPGLRPVLDDAERVLRREVEESIDRTSYDDIEVEEEDVAFEAREVSLKERYLSPRLPAVALRQLYLRRRSCLDFAPEAAGIVGEADEAEGATRVAGGHRVERVGVFRAVSRPPFHANDRLHGLRVLAFRMFSSENPAG